MSEPRQPAPPNPALHPETVTEQPSPHPNWAALVPDPQQPWQTLSSEVLSEQRRFVRDRVALHGGGQEVYLYHPRGPRAAFILPITPEGQGVLIRQYRYPLRATITEVVAGGIEPGEGPLEAAKRELLEEVGGVAAHWEALPGFYAQPSLSGAVFYPWLALDTALGEAHNEDSELIERLVLPLDEIYRRLEQGEILNGPSALVLYQARTRLQALGLLP